MRPVIALWLLLGAVLSSPAVAAANDCIPVDVTMDVAHHAIDMRFRPPAGVTRLALKDLAPYSRKALWQSPDGSASIENDALVATPGHRVMLVRMDVAQAPERQDRAYAPFLRFGDGTVAVDSQLFLRPEDEREKPALCPRYIAAKGQQVIGFGKVADDALSSPRDAEGYVALGTPRVLRHNGLLLVTDREIPDALRERVAADVPRLVDFYTQRLGPAATPMVLLYNVRDDRGTRNFHGDHLPLSITLGLSGQGWDTLDEDGWNRLTGFLAHELFHTWNSAPVLGSPEGEALLAKEGGAELARIMAVASLTHRTPAQWLPEVASLYNACLFEQTPKQSVAQTLAVRAPGSLPYDCGAPLMVVLAMAANPHDPVAGYFGLWKTLTDARRAQPASGYAWTDLVPASAPGALWQVLIRAIQLPDAYADNMPSALARVGIVAEPATRLSSADSHRYAAALMAHLMKLDCGGSVSFWHQPDGFLLDKDLTSCHTLKMGETVDKLLGHPLATADLLALSAQVSERCARGQAVQVGYKGEETAPSDSNVPCTKPLPPSPRPLDFRGMGDVLPLTEAAPAHRLQ